MVGEMVQNSQSLYSFTFNVVIVIHEYIYSHSTTELTFKKYIYSHLTAYFLSTIIYTHIQKMSSFTFNALYLFTFTIRNIHSAFSAQHLCALLGPSSRSIISSHGTSTLFLFSHFLSIVFRFSISPCLFIIQINSVRFFGYVTTLVSCSYFSSIVSIVWFSLVF